MNDLANVKSVYMIGIKGAGMSALATLLKSRNIAVSGSDTKDVFHTDETLRNAVIDVYEGFKVSHVPDDVDLVVYSTAYDRDSNIEIITAQEKRLPMLSYPQVVGVLLREKFGIAVAGTHGKSTTSAILAHVLKQARRDPSAIIGAYVHAWQGNALIGKGKYFVAEADEYQNKLEHYDPIAVILTSVDYDHPDFFASVKEYKKTFADFVARIPKHGFLIAYGDDPNVVEIIKHAGCSVITYGFGEENEFVIKNYEKLSEQDYITYKTQRKNIDAQKFDLDHSGHFYGTFPLHIPGRHNALNAVAVIALGEKLGLSMMEMREGLLSFTGTARRFEFKGQYSRALFFDDYAHHPEEIRATLMAAREQFLQKRMWTIFHPHTFSRTAALLDDFVNSFELSDHVVILDIYSSAREKVGTVSSKDIVDAINRFVSGKAFHVHNVEEAAALIKDSVESDDVVITMGAGDVWRMHDMLGVKNTRSLSEKLMKPFS